MFVNAGVQTNALDKLIRVQTVDANAVKMRNALIHRNVLMENAKTVSNCPSYDPAYELFDFPNCFDDFLNICQL